MKARYIILGSCASLLLIAVVGFLVVVNSLPTVFRKTAPAGVKKTGVMVGAGVFEKTVFVEASDPFFVTDIRTVRDSRDGESVVAVAGPNGILLSLGFGVEKRFVPFADNDEVSGGTRVAVVPAGAKGAASYLWYGDHDRGIGLLDADGRTVWSRADCDEAVAADLDKDGESEFIAADTWAEGTLCVLDSKGGELWSKSEPGVNSIAAVDTDGDGRLEALSNAKRRGITVRRSAGDTIRHVQPSQLTLTFCPCRWPMDSPSDRLVVPGSGFIYLLNLDGTTALRLDAPECRPYGGDFKAIPIQFGSGAPGHLAVLASFFLWERSVLYIYDERGKLVYQEVLADNCRALAALPSKGSTETRLLVGGEEKVWEYRPAARSRT